MSTIIFALTTFICWYGIKLLVKLADELEYYDNRYDVLCGKIWGNLGSNMINFFIILLQVSNAILFI